MKSEKTYNGLTLEYYNEVGNITFYVEGTHDINEDYYNVAVNAREDGKGNVVVETTDNYGYDYDNVVRTAIVKLSHYNILFDEPTLSPKKAQDLLYSVRKDLDTLIALGESYAHFQSAQATHKYLKKAKNALKGLS
jgi:hypothetical protein